MSQFYLRTETARERMKAAWDHACTFLELGKAVQVTVDEAKDTRSSVQNAKFHAICGDLAKAVKWAGKEIDTEGWKRLLVDAWARETGRLQGMVVPSLDGQSVVNLGIQTRSMKVADMAELIEFAEAHCIEAGVEPAKVPETKRKTA